jgi:hypothetical protein
MSTFGIEEIQGTVVAGARALTRHAATSFYESDC